MKVEEYEALINKMISSPDESAATGKSILEAIKADDAERTSLAETAGAQKKKIAELNSELFMTATGKGKEPEEEHKETPKEAFNRMFDERFYPKKEGDK